MATNKSFLRKKVVAIPTVSNEEARAELANRLFFRLYQCANMLHKTGTKAVEAEGLTTQQWAVLGALSRPAAQGGMSIGDLARYLLVSRQNLSGLISRMERDGHVASAPDGRDRRSRLVTMTESGREVWQVRALPKIRLYYERALADFSINDMTHTLHYLLKMLDNMQGLDPEAQDKSEDGDSGTEAVPVAAD
jgi:DNA-binding MarR family transcriptional regulator